MKGRQIRIVLAAISLLAGLLLSQSVALADLQIKGNTDVSHFNASSTNLGWDVPPMGGWWVPLTLGHLDRTDCGDCNAGFIALAFDKWAHNFAASDDGFSLTLAPGHVFLGHGVWAVLGDGRLHQTDGIDNTVATPEPSVIVLLAIMILCLGVCVRKFQPEH